VSQGDDHWRFWIRTENALYEIEDVSVKYLEDGYLFEGTFNPGFLVPTSEGLLVEKNYNPLHTFAITDWNPLYPGDDFRFTFRLLYEEE